MILPPEVTSSSRCAIQPTMRAVANSGVYSDLGRPSILYTKPEYISTLAHIGLSLPFFSLNTAGVSFSTSSIRSISSEKPSLSASGRAARLSATARGSLSV